MPMKHDKNKIPLLSLLINCIAPQMLSLEKYHALHFLNFQIIVLCNASAIFWFSELELIHIYA